MSPCAYWLELAVSDAWCGEYPAATIGSIRPSTAFALLGAVSSGDMVPICPAFVAAKRIAPVAYETSKNLQALAHHCARARYGAGSACLGFPTI
jgi:hypothetical protein